MRSISLLFALSVVACGGDDDPMVKVPDASVQQIDAPAASCAAMSDYASPTPAQQGVLRFCGMGGKLVKCPSMTTQGTDGTTADPVMVVYVAKLNAANDFFSLEAWRGNSPIAPASNVDLSGQSQWKTCGLCAYVSAQVNLQTGDDQGTYLASTGTANLTTVTLADMAANTKFAGSVSNVTMTHIDIAQDLTSTPSADGCSTKLTALSFDAAMGDPMMSFTGDKLDQLENYFLKRLNARYAR